VCIDSLVATVPRVKFRMVLPNEVAYRGSLVADAARVLGVSASTVGSLASKGTIPSLRIGKRVLLPVKALEESIEGRLAEDADRYHSAWTSVRAYAQSTPAPTKGRGYPRRRSW
jgi:excisionase family DNA binding protein